MPHSKSLTYSIINKKTDNALQIISTAQADCLDALYLACEYNNHCVVAVLLNSKACDHNYLRRHAAKLFQLSLKHNSTMIHQLLAKKCLATASQLQINPWLFYTPGSIKYSFRLSRQFKLITNERLVMMHNNNNAKAANNVNPYLQLADFFTVYNNCRIQQLLYRYNKSPTTTKFSNDLARSVAFFIDPDTKQKIPLSIDDDGLPQKENIKHALERLNIDSLYKHIAMLGLDQSVGNDAVGFIQSNFFPDKQSSIANNCLYYHPTEQSFYCYSENKYQAVYTGKFLFRILPETSQFFYLDRFGQQQYGGHLSDIMATGSGSTTYHPVAQNLYLCNMENNKQILCRPYATSVSKRAVVFINSLFFTVNQYLSVQICNDALHYYGKSLPTKKTTLRAQLDLTPTAKSAKTPVPPSLLTQQALHADDTPWIVISKQEITADTTTQLRH